jgi:hypothetical protein
VQSDQKTSKFFVASGEESITGHMGVGKENKRGAWWVPDGVCQPREHVSALQVLLKPTLIYGKGEPGDSHPIINEWGGACWFSIKAWLI